MNGCFAPRRIDPGWLQRWTRSALELVRRSPVSFASVLSAAIALQALIPFSAILVWAQSVLLCALVFILARQTDRHCPSEGDDGVLSETACVLLKHGPDLLKLSAEVTMIFMIPIIVIGIAHLLAGGGPDYLLRAMGGSGMTAAATAHTPSGGWDRLPAVLRRMSGNAGPDAMLAAMPEAQIILYLTLSLGAGLRQHYLLARQSCRINQPVALFFMGILCVLVALDSLAMGAVATARGASVFCLAQGLATLVLCLWGYFWACEMFEGRRGPEARTAKAWKAPTVPQPLP